MDTTDKSPLKAALTPHEMRWAMDLADKLPDDIDLQFEEVRVLTRIPKEQWPKQLMDKVRDLIGFENLLDNGN